MNMPTLTWKPLYESRTKSGHVDQIIDVHQKLTEKIRHSQKFPMWEQDGFIGALLLLNHLDSMFPQQGFDLKANAILKSCLERHPNFWQTPLALIGGLSGLGLAIALLNNSAARYGNILTGISVVVNERVPSLLKKFEKRSNGVPSSDYDLVSGISGIGAFLLTRSVAGYAQPALLPILELLVSTVLDKSSMTGFVTPTELLRGALKSGKYEYGLINCGLAHGIPGILALLSLACTNNIFVDRIEFAIEKLAEFLIDSRYVDDIGLDWPAAIPFDLNGHSKPATCNGRGAWCYGTPGVARSLWLAGQGVNNQSYKDIAVEGMLTTCRRSDSELLIQTPSFCHGIAGLLHIYLRFYNDTGIKVFSETAIRLLAKLQQAHQEDSKFGFPYMESRSTDISDGAGLVTGSAGIALVLASALSTVEPTWDRFFLLS